MPCSSLTSVAVLRYSHHSQTVITTHKSKVIANVCHRSGAPVEGIQKADPRSSFQLRFNYHSHSQVDGTFRASHHLSFGPCS